MRQKKTFPRGILLYLLLVVIPTLVLMAISAESVRRQLDAIRRLTDSNRQLAGERLVAEIESFTMSDVENCLRIAGTSHLSTVPIECSALGELFVVQDGELLYPGGRNSLFERTARDLRYVWRPPVGKICALARAELLPAQLFYTRVPAAPGHGRFLVVALDLKRFREWYLPAAGVRIGVHAEVDPVMADNSPRVLFRGMFPFWQVRLAESAADRVEGRDRAIYKTTLSSVILVMALGMYLLVRANIREWRLNRQRASFIGGFSHELKTPLTNVLLYAELLRDGGALSNTDTSFCNVIVAEAERLRRRIDKVLSTAAIDQGRCNYELRETDLCDLTIRTVAGYRNWLNQQGFILDVRMWDSPLPVRLDADAASDAILNLLENAVKYSGNSRLIELQTYPLGRFAIVEVQDHGIGIPQHDQGKIFDQFYRARAQAGLGGFGLGLFLVHNIMQAHGGKVEVESAPGSGSRFHLVFPLCERF